MKYYIINLGCKVNAYEAKVMSDLLDNNGYVKGSIDDADIYIVNTCFVTNVAEHKSFQMIRKIVGYKGEILTDPSKPEGMYRKLVDTSKINQLGWHPRHTLENGLQLTYQWFLDHIV